jgi:RNA polymerase sigma-70 factor (ECF subfamily)
MYGCETEDEAVTAGPDVVFSEVFRTTYPDVLAFMRRRVDGDVAEDLAAEVFAIAWNRWTDVPREVRPWLFGVAQNVLADDRRAQGRWDRLVLRIGTARAPADDDPIAATTSVLDLHVAWARLRDADREVLALVTWDGLTGREAAQILRCTRAAFSVRLSRARDRVEHRWDRLQERSREGNACNADEQVLPGGPALGVTVHGSGLSGGSDGRDLRRDCRLAFIWGIAATLPHCTRFVPCVPQPRLYHFFHAPIVEPLYPRRNRDPVCRRAGSTPERQTRSSSA